ncbi:uncharacterized protein LOC144886408 [Branchiostoma floridae x Branchiostoma japonicum]
MPTVFAMPTLSEEVKTLREKLLDLREKTSRLDVSESRRRELLDGVSDFAGKALEKLQDGEAAVYTGAGDNNNNNNNNNKTDGKGLRSSPIQEEPVDLGKCQVTIPH